MSSLDFSRYDRPRPEYEHVAAEYSSILEALAAAETSTSALAAVDRWDALRRRLADWQALVGIRFQQDTQNVDYQAAREYSDEMSPQLTDLSVRMKRAVMDSRFGPEIVAAIGGQAFRIWECDLASFEPVIQDDLRHEARLDREYTELTGGAQIEFQGETLTLSELQRFAEAPDRELRHAAARTRWDWFARNATQLDRIFDDLVKVRHDIGTKLGQTDFIPVGYQRMHRIDYCQDDVARFRSAVKDHVVPLTQAIRRAQSEALGIMPLMAWDEPLHAPEGNPRPAGDHDWMLQQASAMFSRIGHGMDTFFEQLRAGNLMDLKSREGKAGGGFCDLLPEFGMPFIFANFNGTKHDVEVFTHEVGHAFQCYSSLSHRLSDYFFPTYESCEIHSMGLEFLTWPHMELFFGDDAERFRRLHLTQSLLFLPYGVAVDHFQHEVYARPEATADERAAIWRRMEETYLPTLQWGDLAHPASGRRWQGQSHVFGSPFYYIDYTLALTCALQLWVQSQSDPADTMERYVALCRRGGEDSFGQLVSSAGLISPFAEGCLQEVVEQARDTLGLAR